MLKLGRFKVNLLATLIGLILPLNLWAAEPEPLFLDMGGFGIYRLNQSELDLLSDQHIEQAYETYVRRYFAAFMYITRNIVAIEVHQGYSPTIVNPIIFEFNMLPATEKRQRIYDIYLKADGLKVENERIFNRVVKLVDDWDIKKGFPRVPISKPDNDPNDIRRIYLRKLGLPDKKFIINTESVKSPLLIEALNKAGVAPLLIISFIVGIVLGFALSKVKVHAKK